MGHPTWPLFDLCIRTARLELRLATDDELVALCAVARAGIHAPGDMPFGVPWSVKESPRFEREFVQHAWLGRASWSAADWRLDLGVFADGLPVGSQGVGARDFATLKEVGTGSWLGRAFQGRGWGREMREAVLAFSFDHLGAEIATTRAFTDNVASTAVSRSLGYEPNGLDREAPQGIPRGLARFRMTRSIWSSRERSTPVVTGLDGCREMFGL